MITNGTPSRYEGKLILAINDEQIIVTPGNKINIQIGIINQSDNEGYFDIQVRGVSSDLITIDTPVVHLAAGEEKQVILSIQTHPILPSRISKFTLDVRAVSLSDPNLEIVAHNLIPVVLHRSENLIRVIIG